MFESFLIGLSRFVVRSRALVIGAMIVLGVVFGSQIPRISADFTPSDLFASFEDQEAVMEEFHNTFGNTDNVILILLEAEDVYDPRVLTFQHTLSQDLGEQDYVGRLSSMTELPLPRAPTEEVGEDSTPQSSVAAGLAQLSGQLLGNGDTAEAEGSRFGQILPAIVGERATQDESDRLREVVAQSGLLRGTLVSEDGTLSAIVLQLAHGLDRNEDIERVVDDVTRRVDEFVAPEGVRVRYGGLPYLRAQIIDRMRADQSVMLPGAILVCILILFAAFRWWPAMALPTLAVILSAVLLVGGMAAVSEPFNILNNIIPLVVIIIGISDAIHLVNRYLEELREGDSHLLAGERTVYTMAAACFLTSFTTAVGFASLAVAQTSILRRFGWTAAFGVMAAYFVTILLLPALLAAIKPPKQGRSVLDEGRFEELIEWFTRLIMRFPWTVLVGSTLVMGVAGWAGSRVSVDSAVLDQFDPSDEIYQTTRLVEDKLTGIRPLEIYLTSEEAGRFDDPEVLEAITRVERWALEQDGVLGALSYPDYLREVRAGMRGEVETRSEPFASNDAVELYAGLLLAREDSPLLMYTTQERDRVRINIQLRDFGAQRTISLTHDLIGTLEQELGSVEGVEYQLTGDAYIGSLGLSAVIQDLLGSLGVAILIIFGFMTLVFRSVRFGLLSIPPNVAPLLVTLAFMSLMGIPLNAATVIIFSVSIGLAVDGTIHVMARFREESERASSTEEALVRSARGTGKAIALTGASLMLGFAVMLSSSFVPIQRFGLLIGVTVFGTLVSTIVVLPALLVVVWRNNGTADHGRRQ